MHNRMFRGERLRQERQRRGWTQQELMFKVGVGQNQIWRYEQGEREPPAYIVARLAQELEVTTDYLFGLTDKPDRVITEDDLSPDEKEFLSALRTGKLRTLLLRLIEQTVSDNETGPDAQQEAGVAGEQRTVQR